MSSTSRHSVIATQDLIDALPWPVCCLDAQGKHLLANSAYQALCRQPLSVIIGQTLSQTWPGELGLRLEFERFDIMQQGGRRRTEELWALPDADHWFDVQWSPVTVSEGAGLLLAAHDIDRQVRALEASREARETLEQAVRERTAALEAANEELESFSYSVSHDLKAPLRAIEGFAELLTDDSAQAQDKRAWLDELIRATKRMNNLIADLLRLARVDRQPVMSERVDLTALCHRCIERIEQDRPGKPSTWLIEESMQLRSDPGLLELALYNLLDNAHKFSRPSATPTIAVSLATLQDGSALVQVIDNGVGFDMTQSGRLFGVFQRLHSADSFPGTGIGLAIVRRVARRLGGHVGASALATQGACFSLVLPQA
jgi:signal transduction histidine kinase